MMIGSTDEPIARGYGTGPGAFTADGNAVELYTRLPAGAEPDVIAGVVPEGASILELGAGAGRITHPLVERGYRVVAVDDSRGMLERIKGARTVHGSIEELSLDERFDAVLLGSFLVNTTQSAARAEMLRCCRRHVAPGGRVLIQRQGEDWFNGRRTSGSWDSHGVRTWIASVDRVAPDVCAVRIEYEIDGHRWTHSFQAQDVPDPALERSLHEAGLTVARYLTDDHSWVEAAARDQDAAR
jgi:SAM-dependent methyltransferase